MAEIEETVPSILLPCNSCGRTFRPDALSKHTKYCEKSLIKKRKVFDSAKQRIQGTDLAEFLPVIAQKKKCDKSPIRKIQSKWKEKHMELVRAIRAARVCPSDGDTPVKPVDHEKCLYCERYFGPKAYDRHLEWCKEHSTRIQPKSPASIQAKERLEARTKYKAPLLNKTRRASISEKYSPKGHTRDPSPAEHLTRTRSSSLSSRTVSSSTRESLSNVSNKNMKNNAVVDSFRRNQPGRNSRRSISPLKKTPDSTRNRTVNNNMNQQINRSGSKQTAVHARVDSRRDSSSVSKAVKDDIFSASCNISTITPREAQKPKIRTPTNNRVPNYHQRNALSTLRKQSKSISPAGQFSLNEILVNQKVLGMNVQQCGLISDIESSELTENDREVIGDLKGSKVRNDLFKGSSTVDDIHVKRHVSEFISHDDGYGHNFFSQEKNKSGMNIEMLYAGPSGGDSGDRVVYSNELEDNSNLLLESDPKKGSEYTFSKVKFGCNRDVCVDCQQSQSDTDLHLIHRKNLSECCMKKRIRLYEVKKKLFPMPSTVTLDDESRDVIYKEVILANETEENFKKQNLFESELVCSGQSFSKSASLSSSDEYNEINYSEKDSDENSSGNRTIIIDENDIDGAEISCDNLSKNADETFSSNTELTFKNDEMISDSWAVTDAEHVSISQDNFDIKREKKYDVQLETFNKNSLNIDCKSVDGNRINDLVDVYISKQNEPVEPNIVEQLDENFCKNEHDNATNNIICQEVDALISIVSNSTHINKNVHVENNDSNSEMNHDYREKIRKTDDIVERVHDVVGDCNYYLESQNTEQDISSDYHQERIISSCTDECKLMKFDQLDESEKADELDFSRKKLVPERRYQSKIPARICKIPVESSSLNVDNGINSLPSIKTCHYSKNSQIVQKTRFPMICNRNSSIDPAHKRKDINKGQKTTFPMICNENSSIDPAHKVKDIIKGSSFLDCSNQLSSSSRNISKSNFIRSCDNDISQSLVNDMSSNCSALPFINKFGDLNKTYRDTTVEDVSHNSLSSLNQVQSFESCTILYFNGSRQVGQLWKTDNIINDLKEHENDMSPTLTPFEELYSGFQQLENNSESIQNEKRNVPKKKRSIETHSTQEKRVLKKFFLPKIKKKMDSSSKSGKEKRTCRKSMETYDPYKSAERQMKELLGLSDEDDALVQSLVPQPPVINSLNSAFVKFSPLESKRPPDTSYSPDSELDNDFEKLEAESRLTPTLTDRCGIIDKNFNPLSLSTISLCSTISIESFDNNRNNMRKGISSSAKVHSCDRKAQLPLQRSVSVVETPHRKGRDFLKNNLKMEHLLFGVSGNTYNFNDNPLDCDLNDNSSDKNLKSSDELLKNSNSSLVDTSRAEQELLKSVSEFEKLFVSASSLNPFPTLIPSSSPASTLTPLDNIEKHRSQPSKFITDSAYNSLNRKSPQQQESPVDNDNSSSGSECSSTRGKAAQSANFCHECGAKFPVLAAKFCCNCGVRRLVI